MKIEALDLIHLRLPLVHPFETSFGRQADKETIIVRVEGGGYAGWGEAPAAAFPGYSYETTSTVWHVIRDFLAPKLKGVEIHRPGPISEFYSAVRGHPMAKAGVEMAILDLLARAQGQSVSRVLGGTQREIPTGVSLGIEERLEDLLDRVARAVEAGYRRVKLKIKPKRDVDVVAAVRARFPKLPLMVDANAAYTLDDAEHLKELDAFGLTMIEQPLDPGDLVDHAALAKRIATPICLDESIATYQDGRRALAIGACSIVNIKQARVGGPYAGKALHNVCAAKGVPVWCGGLLETGIGRMHNVALASLPGFVMPGDISASERYFREDVIDPPVRVGPQGTIAVPEGPGIGVTVLESRLARHQLRRERVLGGTP